MVADAAAPRQSSLLAPRGGWRQRVGECRPLHSYVRNGPLRNGVPEGQYTLYRKPKLAYFRRRRRKSRRLSYPVDHSTGRFGDGIWL